MFMENITMHIKEWKRVLGGFLIGATVRAMTELRAKMEKLREEIEYVVTGAEKFKVVMQAISDVKKYTVQAEVEYDTYQVN